MIVGTEYAAIVAPKKKARARYPVKLSLLLRNRPDKPRARVVSSCITSTLVWAVLNSTLSGNQSVFKSSSEWGIEKHPAWTKTQARAVARNEASGTTNNNMNAVVNAVKDKYMEGRICRMMRAKSVL